MSHHKPFRLSRARLRAGNTWPFARCNSEAKNFFIAALMSRRRTKSSRDSTCVIRIVGATRTVFSGRFRDVPRASIAGQKCRERLLSC